MIMFILGFISFPIITILCFLLFDIWNTKKSKSLAKKWIKHDCCIKTLCIYFDDKMENNCCKGIDGSTFEKCKNNKWLLYTEDLP